MEYLYRFIDKTTEVRNLTDCAKNKNYLIFIIIIAHKYLIYIYV